MNWERLMAGAFAGIGAIYMIYEGTRQAQPYLVTSGAVLISSMMSFFVGEVNGKRAIAEDESEGS